MSLASSYAKASDGTRLAYQIQGTGPGLVLLAGQANSHHWWDHIRDDFPGRTITVDYRGTGHSGAPTGGYRTATFADDVIAVLDHAGIDQADMYGTSMGGRVAQLLAAQHPHRVRRLVLGCTSPGGRHSVERATPVRRALAHTDRSVARRALLEFMYTPAWLDAHQGPYQVLGDPTMTAHARQNHLRASNGHDAWDVLPKIKAPTLIVHGSDDRLNPVANAWLLARRIPHSQVRILPRGRHAYFHEFRDTASGLVTDFLAAAAN